MNDNHDDLNTWTYFEFVTFAGKDYGYIRKRDSVQTLYFNDKGALMVNLNAEASCTPSQMAELDRIAFMVLGGKDIFDRVINPFCQIPRRLVTLKSRD
ncbi:MAG: hypothetical protein ACUVSX_08645 [Aggregatilineales bacterium]